VSARAETGSASSTVTVVAGVSLAVIDLVCWLSDDFVDAGVLDTGYWITGLLDAGYETGYWMLDLNFRLHLYRCTKRVRCPVSGKILQEKF
jgi:hypothetical protein